MPRRAPRPCGHCDAIHFGAGGGVLEYQITPLPEPVCLFLISHGCCLRMNGRYAQERPLGTGATLSDYAAFRVDPAGFQASISVSILLGLASRGESACQKKRPQRKGPSWGRSGWG